MSRPIRINIVGKDSFWARAFHVEWNAQHPTRELAPGNSDCFLVRSEWLDDLEEVARQTFCKIVRAPDNPYRREWIGALIPRR